MFKNKTQRPWKTAIFALGACFLSGCVSQPIIALDSPEHIEKINEDRQKIYNQTLHNQSVALTLDQAVDMAIESNLDLRISAIESLIAKDNISLAQFRGMPNITSSGTYTSRNNLSASSSRSVLTGVQSLEPSTSSDPSRRLSELQAQWNVVDSVIAYLDGKSAEDTAIIAKERLKKVKTTLEHDTLNAYIRTYARQKSIQTIDKTLSNFGNITHNIGKASSENLISIDNYASLHDEVLAEHDAINRINESLQLSDVEFKSLLSIPPSTSLNLVTTPNDIGAKYKINTNGDIETDIKTALQNRPELRELFANTNISVRNTEKELISSFPGLNLIYSRSYDSNSFLSDSQWTNFSAALTQNISNFISLPTRYRASKNQEELVVERRRALTAAIIAQVYIGRIRIDIAEKNYKIASTRARVASLKSYSDANQSRLGSKSSYSSFLAGSQSLKAEIEKNISFAELQVAYADMMNTLGLSLFNHGDKKS